ncbi:DUF421 domain-containing protein [Pedobacter alpinus]|uniref:DUF421 domain-containing protein n=1 Tax=Pedobacter alpinus TaxID=1590643 RepID=A0ABW5TQV3_9SPHI
MKEIFEWNRLLMNDLPYSFLLEVLFRCVVMYLVAMLVLKLAGRRGVKQLSVFELVIILTLGSAAGDPLFYQDVGLIPAICVFIIILLLYRGTTFLISRSKKIETWLEGKPIYLIEDGEFSIDNFSKEALAQDEFFTELRLKNITHLGQVDLAILETNGQISIFFYDEKNIKMGLPILPHAFNKTSNSFKNGFQYACKFCGNIQEATNDTTEHVCDRCGKDKWVSAINEKRIT